MWIDSLDRWLLTSSVFGALVLLLGSLCLRFIRQPVHRIRVIQCTLVACILVPALQQLELLPGYSLGLWPTENEPSLIPASTTAQPQRSVEPKASRPESSSMMANHTKQTQRNALAHETSVSASQRMNGELGENNLVGLGTSAPWWSHLTPCLLPTIRITYAIGLVLTASWLALGWLARRRIIATSQPANNGLRMALQRIAGAQADHVRLLTHDRISSPIMWGIFRPTIVIPSKLAKNPTELNLQFALAHEWSHVARYDFLNLTLANLVKFVCFYQPAFWWLRKQLTLSQDYLADEFAANLGEQMEDYAAFLVTLARQQRSIETIGVLCMADRKSALLRRVCMLVDRTNPLQQRIGRRSAFIMAAFTLMVIASLGALRFGAQAAEKPLQEPTKEKPLAEDKKLPAPITYKGKVIDKDSGTPIVGAVVEISHELLNDPKTKAWSEIEVTIHETDKMGEYQFTLPPEQVAEPSLCISVTTMHPEYQQKGPEGDGYSTILKNLEFGEPPFFETIKLAKGEPISFRVLQPNGKPSVDTQILAYSKARNPNKPEGMDWEYGAFQKSQTDANGFGKFVVAGDGVIWVFPKDHTPVAVRIGKKRGQIDDIVLRDGVRLTGQVLSTRGEPIANVAVNVVRNGDGDEADDFLNKSAVANHISSGALTDASGNFALRSLPPGTYCAVVESKVNDPAVPFSGRLKTLPEPLQIDEVFWPLEVKIEPNATMAPIEIRAVPHVIVRGRYFDSKGNPRSGLQQDLYSQNDGQSYDAQSTTSGPDGWFEFKVPHGLQKAQIDLVTNEHSVLRWRMNPNDPLQNTRGIRFERLDADVTTIEIVRYEAPTLLVKAVDENGNALPEFKPQVDYIHQPEGAAMPRYTAGGNVHFEKQPDHRRRSSHLLPDEEFKISIDLDGFETEPRTLSVPEGETRELVFVMKKK